MMVLNLEWKRKHACVTVVSLNVVLNVMRVFKKEVNANQHHVLMLV